MEQFEKEIHKKEGEGEGGVLFNPAGVKLVSWRLMVLVKRANMNIFTLINTYHVLSLYWQKSGVICKVLHPILDTQMSVLRPPSRSDHPPPPLSLKRGGLDSSGQRLISINS